MSRTRDRHLGLSILALLLALSAGPATAQSNEDCMMCHEDPEAKGTRGGREISVFVDPVGYGASVHAGFACIDCHGDLDGVELPHPEELEPVDCATCHDEPAAAIAEGPHGKWATDPVSPAGSCVRCHGTHDVLRPGDPNSPVNRIHATDLCATCHRSQLRQVGRSPHGQPAAAGGPNAACIDCHHGHSVTAPRDLTGQFSSCGSCHPRQAAEHRRSLHGRAGLKGDALAPNCVTCHEHHAIRPHTDIDAPTAIMNIPLLCGRCHREGTEVSLQHDIPQDRILENFSMSVHGEGLFKKGLTVTAVCTSCHTSHLILDHNNPDSSINRANVAKTCTQCHAAHRGGPRQGHRRQAVGDRAPQDPVLRGVPPAAQDPPPTGVGAGRRQP